MQANTTKGWKRGKKSSLCLRADFKEADLNSYNLAGFLKSMLSNDIIYCSHGEIQLALAKELLVMMKTKPIKLIGTPQLYRSLAEKLGIPYQATRRRVQLLFRFFKEFGMIEQRSMKEMHTDSSFHNISVYVLSPGLMILLDKIKKSWFEFGGFGLKE